MTRTLARTNAGTLSTVASDSGGTKRFRELPFRSNRIDNGRSVSKMLLITTCQGQTTRGEQGERMQLPRRPPLARDGNQTPQHAKRVTGRFHNKRPTRRRAGRLRCLYLKAARKRGRRVFGCAST